MMLREERFYPSFRQHPLYVRMLAELDMLKEPSLRGSDDGEGGERGPPRSPRPPRGAARSVGRFHATGTT